MAQHHTTGFLYVSECSACGSREHPFARHAACSFQHLDPGHSSSWCTAPLHPEENLSVWVRKPYIMEGGLQEQARLAQQQHGVLWLSGRDMRAWRRFLPLSATVLLPLHRPPARAVSILPLLGHGVPRLPPGRKPPGPPPGPPPPQVLQMYGRKVGFALDLPPRRRDEDMLYSPELGRQGQGFPPVPFSVLLPC
jgi:hypothetical protein